MEQLDARQKTLHILLREMSIGSEAFRQAVNRELRYFEDELCDELTRMTKVTGHDTYQPALAAKAITRLVFTMGAAAADLPPEQRGQIIEETVIMIKMIMEGAQSLAKKEKARSVKTTS